MFRKFAKDSVLTLAICVALACNSAGQDSSSETGATSQEVEVSGTLTPVGPPLDAPTKIDIGKECIVELTKKYEISGTLSGAVQIDYRILVHGPCGVAPGTYDEDWIAYGTFVGSCQEEAMSCKFSYVASVKAGGNVEGRILLGRGLDGKLDVSGNFNDGMLRYKGWVKAE